MTTKIFRYELRDAEISQKLLISRGWALPVVPNGKEAECPREMGKPYLARTAPEGETGPFHLDKWGFHDNESSCNIFLTLARRQAIISYGMYFPRLAPDSNRVEINNQLTRSFFV